MCAKLRPTVLFAITIGVALCIVGCSAHGSLPASVASSDQPAGRGRASARIAPADVRRVLSALDSTDTATFAEAIDMASFLDSVLSELHPLGQSALCGPPPSDEEQRLWISEVVTRYRENVARVGAEAALSCRSPDVANESSEHSAQLEIMTTYGLSFSGVMFRSPDFDSAWTWHVVGISVTGTDTADVRYVATDAPSVMSARTPDRRWRFEDRSMVYTKQLRFSQGADRRWRLVGWPNYVRFSEAVLGNIVPKPDLVVQDQWWSAL